MTFNDHFTVLLTSFLYDLFLGNDSIQHSDHFILVYFILANNKECNDILCYTVSYMSLGRHIKPEWIKKVSIFMSFVKSLLFIIKMIWLNVTIVNCALPNYNQISEIHRELNIFNLLLEALIVHWLAITKW